jgi:formylmethanofuran dehydrogenase subunit B
MAPVSHVVENVACTLCGCVCDDLRITTNGRGVTSAGRACGLAEPWFLKQNGRTPPATLVEGRDVAFDQGLSRGAAILAAADAPLIYGLSRSSTPGQRAAVALADRLGATIDTTASLCHGPSIMALQESGESTCSLGEIRSRSDLVVFWGCDPAVTHPRHFERYSVEPSGEFRPQGRRDRTVIVVDRAPSATSAQADLFLQVAPDRDFEALWALRRIIHGDPLPEGIPTGLSIEQLHDLASRMKRCQSGVLFFGLGLSQTGIGHLNVSALLLLVRDLHRHTRFYARRLRIYGDVTGADSVLCWQTGYPYSVNLGRGYPRFNPGEFSADELLARNEVDACVLVGSETVELFSLAAQDHLQRIPTIVLDYPDVEPPWTPTVKFTTAVYGVHRPGTAYRMDEIPIPLRAFLDSPYPSDDEVLDGLLEGLPAAR